MLLKRKITMYAVLALTVLCLGVSSVMLFVNTNGRVAADEPEQCIKLAKVDGLTYYLKRNDSDYGDLTFDEVLGDSGSLEELASDEKFTYTIEDGKGYYKIKPKAGKTSFVVFYALGASITSVNGFKSSTEKVTTAITKLSKKLTIEASDWANWASWGNDQNVTITPQVIYASVNVDYNVTGVEYSKVTVHKSDVDGSADETGVLSAQVGQKLYFFVEVQDKTKKVTDVNYNRQTVTPKEKGGHQLYEIDVVANAVININVGDATYTAGKTIDTTANGKFDVADFGTTPTFGKDFAFTITSTAAAAGYEPEVTITVGDSQLKETDYTVNGSRYTINGDKVTGNIQITVKAEAIQYHVDYNITGLSAQANLSKKPDTANCEDGLEFTLTVSTGYTATVTATVAGTRTTTLTEGTGITKGDAGQYTIAGTNVKGNITVNIVVAAATYTVDAQANIDDKFTVLADSTATYNVNYTFTVAAKSGVVGYTANITIKVGEDPQQKTLTVGDDYTVGNGTYTIHGDQITGKITITGEAEPIKYSVTTSPNSNVKVTVDSQGDIESVLAITTVPNPGYEVSAVTATVTSGNTVTTLSENDGITKKAENSYEIEQGKITGTVVINVELAHKQFDVTKTDKGTGYTISGAAVQATHGTKYKFSVTPDTGYTLDSVKYSVEGGVQNVEQITAQTAGGINVTIDGDEIIGNITIDVTASKIKYTITLPADVSYTVKVDSVEQRSLSVAHGETATFVVTSKQGYSLEKMMVTFSGLGEVKTGDSGESDERTYTIVNVTSAGNVSISGVERVYNVSDETKDATGNYDLTGLEEIKTALSGTPLTFTVTAHDGYYITSVTVGGTPINAGDDSNAKTRTYSLTVTSYNINIVVNLGKYKYTINYNDGTEPATETYDITNFAESETKSLKVINENLTFYDSFWVESLTKEKAPEIKKSNIADKDVTLNLEIGHALKNDYQDKIKELLPMTFAHSDTTLRMYYIMTNETWTALFNELKEYGGEGDEVFAIGFAYGNQSANKSDITAEAITKYVNGDNINEAATMDSKKEAAGSNAYLYGWKWSEKSGGGIKFGMTNVPENLLAQRNVLAWIVLKVGGEDIVIMEEDYKTAQEAVTASEVADEVAAEQPSYSPDQDLYEVTIG